MKKKSLFTFKKNYELKAAKTKRVLDKELNKEQPCKQPNPIHHFNSKNFPKLAQ